MRNERQKPKTASLLYSLPRNKNLRRRFILIIAVYLLFVVVLWFFCYNTIFRDVQTNTSNMMDLIGDNLADNLDSEFSRMKLATSTIAGSVYVQDFLSETDSTAYYEKAGAVSEIIRKTVYPHMGEDTVLTISAEGIYYRFTGSVSNAALGQLHRLVADGSESYSVVKLDETNYFCIVSPVYSESAVLGGPIGYVVALSNMAKVNRLLDTSDIMEGIDTAIILDDTILFSSNHALDGRAAAELDSSYGSVKVIDIDGSNLKAAAAITKEALSSGERAFLAVSGITLALLIVIVYGLYRVLSVKIVVPTMAEAGTMRMGLLTVQIDAHFLVNTLDSIEALVDQGKTREIKTTARNLAAMLKSRHESGAEINVFEQMVDLERYIEIMNIRHDNKFKVELDADEELSHCRIPGQILQPIVENALTHGLGNKKDDCRLTVTGSLKPDFVHFEISDNGVGLPPAQLLALQDMLDTAVDWEGNPYQLKGVALMNIQRRIREQYGAGYGLTVRAAPKGGLSVGIRLPVIK
jgi:hypothetical protein